MPLYFAPINVLGHDAYRHALLQHDADFVFSELLFVSKFSEPYYERKLLVNAEDIPQTIFQIGAMTTEEVRAGVTYLTQRVKGLREINLNMGCPQSTLQKNAICGGLLYRPEEMSQLAQALALACQEKHIIPSVKLRLGTTPETIRIKEYIALLSEAGIHKMYIHLRTLRYNYTKPAMDDSARDLKKIFPHITIILNGDVDSYERYQQLITTCPCDGVMIGRAALSNPLIFHQIKTNTNTLQGPYDPLRKDPQLLPKGQHIVMGSEKYHFILEFLTRAQDVPLSVIKANLSWLTKGVSAKGAFITAIAQEKNQQNIIETFKAHFSSTKTT